MNQFYRRRFHKLSDLLSKSKFAEHARLKGSNTFSRNRKMPLKDLLLCYLSKGGLLQRIFTTKKALESRSLLLPKP